ncbi:MAG: sensor histidine kinase [Bacilli bacterium]|nr:sensor histidine kinase [Bacilli bacterium]
MKFTYYIKDKILNIIMYFIMILLIMMMLIAFKTPISLIIWILITIFVFGIAIILTDFYRKKAFYNSLLSNVSLLDKAYLVLETIKKPDFYEGEILYQALYEINKSMCENIKDYEMQLNAFKEYIEMWIHEVKIPLSSLVLISHNHKEKSILEQIKRIEAYVEQVLYYVRGENAEKDYLINEVSLKKVINNVAIKNKDEILANKIDFLVNNINTKVYTDSKWLEFIINQIISNSIKYQNKKTKSIIKISTYEKDAKIILEIYDNGIGISASDLPQVFDKTFTGLNGRSNAKSTGMGLFIAKKLCEKLGHKIEIESKKNQFTKVIITFSKNKFYEVVK